MLGLLLVVILVYTAFIDGMYMYVCVCDHVYKASNGIMSFDCMYFWAFLEKLHIASNS